ncbi:MAG: hypothetical protein IKN98_07515 [Bacteroidales bacterium]|nr:hypothetical protein [Bacteroidales bacterium]
METVTNWEPPRPPPIFPILWYFTPRHHSVADGRRQRNLLSPFFRGMPAVRFYLPISVPRVVGHYRGK